MSSAVPSMYPPGPHTLPQLNGPDHNGPSYHLGNRQAPPPPPPPGPMSINGAPPPAGPSGPPQSVAPPLPPYGRTFSPPHELRPLREERPPSPGRGYPLQTPYKHAQPFPGASSMAAGAPAPPIHHQAPEGPPREEHDRPPSAAKRHREWEPDMGPSKKIANEDTRARLDDHSSRRGSPPPTASTPRDMHRRSSSEIRRENQRIADQNYYPSESAHHPAPLAPPPMAAPLPPQHSAPAAPHTPQAQHTPHMPPMANMYDAAKDERKEQVEGAARKINADEDYDEEPEEDKKPVLASLGGSGRTSPRGIANMQPKTESISA